jgi:hypothetical protein
MITRTRSIVQPVLFHALAAAFLTGCAQQSDVDLNRRIAELSEQLAERENRIESLMSANQELQTRVSTIRGFKQEDLNRIFFPERLEIARLSGGHDFDGRPGDDGVRIYLKPIDRDGDALKVAGDIRVDLFDLTDPTGQTQIGSCTFPVDTAREHWYGKFMTYHYTLECKWTRPPKTTEVTVRVTFRDYITQRLLTEQAVLRVVVGER